MTLIETLRSKLPSYIPDGTLYNILFEMNKTYDKEFTVCIQLAQKNTQRVFNVLERRNLRRYYYYKDEKALKEVGISSFDFIKPSDAEKQNVILTTLARIDKYDEKKILDSIITRYQNLKNGILSGDNSEQWLEYYDAKRAKESDYSLAIIDIEQAEFALNGYNPSYIFKRIAKAYSRLENYRHLVIRIKGDLKDKQGNILTWTTLFKLGIYCENFMQFREKFFAFKKDVQISELASFIKSRTGYERSLDLARQFYSTISYGFKYEDLFISDDCGERFLVFKKISLDTRKVLCPSCLTDIQSSNSYPEMFLQSWECKNSNCPDRSKSGRGKRFDEFGVYRYFKLVEDYEMNRIDKDMYREWKRDVFPSKANALEMIVNYYAWAQEKVAYMGSFDVSTSIDERTIEKYNFDKLEFPKDCCLSYSNLPLIILLKSVNKHLVIKTGNKVPNLDIQAANGNSTFLIQNLKPESIGSAITSPPYYNAREYSQWRTLIMYLIDMMYNAKAVYSVLDSKGTYLYNIGDIVSEDNVYVMSNMSKRRLQLGFLSAAIFEMVGFSLNDNIIWDKGEVQSKRNSTVNLNSGYVKCINCYEHVLVFQKSPSTIKFEKIEKFNPVIKINCKGENIYKHTAPYPLEMVELIRNFLLDGKYLLDPFLGSGTTLIWCKKNRIKGFGVELNKEYYELCLENIKNTDN